MSLVTTLQLNAPDGYFGNRLLFKFEEYQPKLAIYLLVVLLLYYYCY